jgi:hypothetical protein
VDSTEVVATIINQDRAKREYRAIVHVRPALPRRIGPAK